MKNKNTLGIILILTLIVLGCVFFTKEAGGISPNEAKAKINSLIEANPANTAEITEVVAEDGLYKITLTSNGQEFYTYMSKDGTKFFPETIDLEEWEKMQAGQPTTEISTKSKRPTVELFVMSYCPYGTQIEKGILPVVKTLGDKIDFKLKFVDYAMHDKIELNEQLQQYCIKEQNPNKFLTYLSCFLEAGNSQSCLADTDIDKNYLQSCISATDNKYKVTENYNDKTTWTQGNPAYPTFHIDEEDNLKYKVSGSPTLVINGETVSVGRDPQSLLTAICSAFETQPEECDQTLSSETPTPGFGYSTTQKATNATCE